MFIQKLKISLQLCIFYCLYGILQGSTLNKASSGISSMHQVSISSSHSKVLLTQNSIRHIPSCYFINLPNLLELQIDAQHSKVLDSIDDFAFNGLYNLTFLDLRDNGLEVVRRNMFKGLVRLQKLSLNSNKIHTVEIGSFSDMTGLEKLWLHLNKLQTVQEGIFDPISHPNNLNDFRIYSDVLECDCDIEWIVDAYGDWIGVSSFAPDTKCSGPTALANENVFTLQPVVFLLCPNGRYYVNIFQF